MVKVNIIKLLDKIGKTKYWLCKNTGISRTNLDNIIKGKTNSISFDYIEKLCFFLKCTPSDLIEIDYRSSYEYDI